MSGIGSTGFGTTPYGSGTPAGSQGRVGKLLMQPNGIASGSRKINPITRDFEFDANGHFVGMGDSQQLVLIAVMNTLGACCVANIGIAPAGGVIGDDFVSRRKRDVSNALAALVKAKLIEVVSIDVDKDARPVMTLIRWRDLTTSLESKLSL